MKWDMRGCKRRKKRRRRRREKSHLSGCSINVLVTNEPAHQRRRPSDAAGTGFHLAGSKLLFPPSFLSTE